MTLRTHQHRAAQAAKGVLQRRWDVTARFRQIDWAHLDALNRRHAMRYREMKVLKRDPFS